MPRKEPFKEMSGILFVLSAFGAAAACGTASSKQLAALQALGWYDAGALTGGGDSGNDPIPPAPQVFPSTGGVGEGKLGADGEFWVEIVGQLVVASGATAGQIWFSATIDGTGATRKVSASGCTDEATSTIPKVFASFALAKILEDGATASAASPLQTGTVKVVGDDWGFTDGTDTYVYTAGTLYKEGATDFAVANEEETLGVVATIVKGSSNAAPAAGIVWVPGDQVVKVINGDETYVATIETTAGVVVQKATFETAELNSGFAKVTSGNNYVFPIKVATTNVAVIALGADFVVAPLSVGADLGNSVNALTLGTPTLVAANDNTINGLYVTIAKSGLSTADAAVFKQDGTNQWEKFPVTGGGWKILVNNGALAWFITSDANGVLDATSVLPASAKDQLVEYFPKLGLTYTSASNKVADFEGVGKKPKATAAPVGAVLRSSKTTDLVVQYRNQFFQVPETTTTGTTTTPAGGLDLTTANNVKWLTGCVLVQELVAIIGGTRTGAGTAADQWNIAPTCSGWEDDAPGTYAYNGSVTTATAVNHVVAVNWTYISPSLAYIGTIVKSKNTPVATDPWFSGCAAISDGFVNCADPTESPAESALPPATDKPKGGLGAGATAGIVVGVVAVVAIAGFLVYWFVFRKGPVGGADGAPAGEGAADAPATAD